MNTVKSISVLNQLLSIQQERFENYEANIIETKDYDLLKSVSEFKNQCQIDKLELIEEIIQLGGLPIDETTSTKKLFYMWLDLKTLFTKTNKEDLIQTWEYNEYLSIKHFRSIIESNIQYFNFKQVQMLKNQLDTIEKNHDNLKSLGDVLLKQHIGYQEKHQSVTL